MPKSYKLYSKGGEHELPADRILCNDVYLPGDTNFNKTRLWVITDACGNFGRTICAVWASNEQDALDEAVDADMLNSLQVGEEDLPKTEEEWEETEYTHLGNAGELFDLSNTGLQEIKFDKVRDWDLLIAFARAAGEDATTLDY